MKLVIVGTGVSGLTAARSLHQEHELILLEKNDRPGGHVHSVDVELEGQTLTVDTGFMVYNEQTYTQFTEILAELDVTTEPATMDFSFRCDKTGLEYSGFSLNSLFSQRSNLLSPRFWKFAWDLKRFNRQCKKQITAEEPEDYTVGEFLQQKNYSRSFMNDFLLPMAGSIWSTDAERVLAYPIGALIRLFDSHGLLNLHDRPVWRFIKGGARQYIDQLIEPFQDKIQYETEAQSIDRSGENGITIQTGEEEISADGVILACHPDQALKLLEQPTQQEQEILGSVRYEDNTAYLHTDPDLLPREPSARASWNFLRAARPDEDQLIVTCDLTRMMDLIPEQKLLVSINASDRIESEKLIETVPFQHPRFTRRSFDAQQQHSSINGTNRTYYCGAYWGLGLHEAGVQSARRVIRALG